MAKVGIVTVLFNSESVLKDFFQTLNDQTFKDFSLYIIDNASTDRGLQTAKELAKEVSFKCIFFEEKENWGIAEGNNIGIKAALKDGCEYILLANNDIVLQPFTIFNLLEGLTNYPASIAVPKIYYYGTNLIWMAGGRFDILKASTPHIGEKKEDNGQFDNIAYINYAPTCFMLIKSNVFERVGFMDKQYFVYYDDSDFIYRCTMAGNENMIFLPNSTIEHKVSVSTKKGSDFYNRMMYRNRILFVRKNYKFFGKILTLLNLFAYHYLIHPFTMDKKEFKTTSKALIEGLTMKRIE